MFSSYRNQSVDLQSKSGFYMMGTLVVNLFGIDFLFYLASDTIPLLVNIARSSSSLKSPYQQKSWLKVMGTITSKTSNI